MVPWTAGKMSCQWLFLAGIMGGGERKQPLAEAQQQETSSLQDWLAVKINKIQIIVEEKRVKKGVLRGQRLRVACPRA